MGANADQAADEALNIGPLSRAARELPEDVRAQIRDTVKESLAKYQTPSGITPGVACWLVGATL